MTLVRDAGGEATHLSQWAGLGPALTAGRRGVHALPAAFAGIPLTSGFTGKFAVFSAAIAGGAAPLVVVGVVMSAIAAFFYFRVVVLMFFSAPAPDGPTVAVPSPLTHAHHRAVRRRHAPARRLAHPGPRPGRAGLAVRPLRHAARRDDVR